MKKQRIRFKIYIFTSPGKSNTMFRYFIQLAYDGSGYHGWQVQPNAPTIQGTVEEALSVVLREKLSVTGAGRTDAGVHASYFVAHLDSHSRDLDQQPGLLYRLNSVLPRDIVIKDFKRADNKLHARFSASYRTYRYHLASTKPLFNRTYCYHYPVKLSPSALQDACDVVKRYSDFTSFSKLHTDVRTNNCQVMEAGWTMKDDGYVFEITADRFLRNMVRSMVGTMLDVGSGKKTVTDLQDIIEARDRSLAGMSAPARGLFLVDIGYPVPIF